MNPQFEALNTLVIGVSPDDAQSHRDFICKYDLPFTLLCDEQKEVLQAYEAWGEKVRFGKKSMGVIRSTVLIDGDGIVKQHWKTVSDAAAHPQQVLEALAAS